MSNGNNPNPNSGPTNPYNWLITIFNEIRSFIIPLVAVGFANLIQQITQSTTTFVQHEINQLASMLYTNYIKYSEQLYQFTLRMPKINGCGSTNSNIIDTFIVNLSSVCNNQSSTDLLSKYQASLLPSHQGQMIMLTMGVNEFYVSLEGQNMIVHQNQLIQNQGNYNIIVQGSYIYITNTQTHIQYLLHINGRTIDQVTYYNQNLKLYAHFDAQSATVSNASSSIVYRNQQVTPGAAIPIVNNSDLLKL